jgi:hypothetical protein
MDAVSAWQAIKDNAIAYQVGKRIQDWIDGNSCVSILPND